MSYLCKQTKAPRKGNSKVIFRLDKPFVLTYMKRKQHLIVKCHYIFTNEHGYSFQGRPKYTKCMYFLWRLFMSDGQNTDPQSMDYPKMEYP